MTGAPHILPPTEDETLKAAARAFLDVIETQALTTYGAEAITALEPGSRVAMLLSLAVQALTTPEAMRAVSLDMDFAAKGIGIALGAQCGAHGFSEGQMGQVLQWFHGGFLRGHQDNRQAIEAMPTQGSMS